MIDEDFGPVPDWVEEASRLQEEADAAAASDLAKCQALIADLRAAMFAASAILHRAGSHGLADRIYDAMGTDARAKAAVRALQEDAGHIARPGDGECYP